MAKTKQKKSGRHKSGGRKPDEAFCSSCDEIIKKDADICLECGVRNRNKDVEKPQGSVGWLIFWMIIFCPVAIWYFLTRRWDQ